MENVIILKNGLHLIETDDYEETIKNIKSDYENYIIYDVKRDDIIQYNEFYKVYWPIGVHLYNDLVIHKGILYKLHFIDKRISRIQMTDCVTKLSGCWEEIIL